MAISQVFMCGPGQPGAVSIASCDYDTQCRMVATWQTVDEYHELADAGWRKAVDAYEERVLCPVHSGFGPLQLDFEVGE